MANKESIPLTLTGCPYHLPRKIIRLQIFNQNQLHSKKRNQKRFTSWNSDHGKNAGFRTLIKPTSLFKNDFLGPSLLITVLMYTLLNRIIYYYITFLSMGIMEVALVATIVVALETLLTVSGHTIATITRSLRLGILSTLNLFANS